MKCNELEDIIVHYPKTKSNGASVDDQDTIELIMEKLNQTVSAQITLLKHLNHLDGPFLGLEKKIEQKLPIRPTAIKLFEEGYTLCAISKKNKYFFNLEEEQGKKEFKFIKKIYTFKDYFLHKGLNINSESKFYTTTNLIGDEVEVYRNNDHILSITPSHTNNILFQSVDISPKDAIPNMSPPLTNPEYLGICDDRGIIRIYRIFGIEEIITSLDPNPKYL